jgi:hypothetical protein
MTAWLPLLLLLLLLSPLPVLLLYLIGWWDVHANAYLLQVLFSQ